MERRTLIAGGAAGGLAGIAAAAYSLAPAFWRQFAADWNRPVASPTVLPDLRDWGDTGLFAAWLGHATVLLKIDGTTILTDPVFSERVGPDLGFVTLGIKRLVAPALQIARLPKIDVILLSHAHFDHFDIPSLRALESGGTRVITALKTGDLLRPRRYAGVRELAWGERTTAGAAELRAFEVRHWGARMRSDTWRGYNGYTVEAGRYRILFGGDTASCDLFRKVRRARPYHLAIMPVGAYNPWIHYHCTPEQALRMAGDAGAEHVLPIHHQTFRLSREPYTEPIERLYVAAGADTHRIALDRIGAEFRL